MLELFYERRKGSFTTLSWALFGALLLALGLFLFKESLLAMLAGRQYAGYVYLRQMSNRVGADIAAILSLVLATGGAMLIHAAVCQAFPALEQRRWFRWTAAMAFGTMFLLILVLGAFVFIARLF